MYRQDKNSKTEKNCTIIKITSFVNHKAKESIIKSTNIIEELKSKEKMDELPVIPESALSESTLPEPEEAKHASELSQKDMSIGEEEEGEAE